MSTFVKWGMGTGTASHRWYEKNNDERKLPFVNEKRSQVDPGFLIKVYKE